MTLKEKSWIKCLKCGSYINMNTHGQYIPCACNAIAVDGNDYCTRIIGKSEDWKIIPDSKKENDN